MPWRQCQHQQCCDDSMHATAPTPPNIVTTQTCAQPHTWSQQQQHAMGRTQWPWYDHSCVHPSHQQAQWLIWLLLTTPTPHWCQCNDNHKGITNHMPATIVMTLHTQLCRGDSVNTNNTVMTVCVQPHPCCPTWQQCQCMCNHAPGANGNDMWRRGHNNHDMMPLHPPQLSMSPVACLMHCSPPLHLIDASVMTTTRASQTACQQQWWQWCMANCTLEMMPIPTTLWQQHAHNSTYTAQHGNNANTCATMHLEPMAMMCNKGDTMTMTWWRHCGRDAMTTVIQGTHAMCALWQGDYDNHNMMKVAWWGCCDHCDHCNTMDNWAVTRITQWEGCNNHNTMKMVWQRQCDCHDKNCTWGGHDDHDTARTPWQRCYDHYDKKCMSIVSVYLVYKIKHISKPIQWVVEREKNLQDFSSTLPMLCTVCTWLYAPA